MCQVYGTPPPFHTCVVGVCMPTPPPPTQPITLPRPLLEADYWGGSPATFPVEEYCEKHGTAFVVDAGSNPGFTGAGIFWLKLSCGCTEMDDSADNIGAVR